MIPVPSGVRVWLAVGRKGASTLRFRRYEVTAQWAGFADKPSYHDAQAVGHKLAELYEAEEVDRVVLIYNTFESALEIAGDERVLSRTHFARHLAERRGALNIVFAVVIIAVALYMLARNVSLS